ncbi:hypothetical protein LMH87_001767 [Akanthomyces muscarius]|uniref:Uncharacterized protein n=1 Tax=Akanthomyces muscarius TaxID=2231603 RepID=A0A9W8Q6D3_AKAMU|nr:hypothetical protein LMH87_001767 [Akanthomyces muscarius]KAJ4147229.1 hypothetical protein LMH87_001767 [Akanthomyces muscarius]
MKSIAVVTLFFAVALAQPLASNGTKPSECHGCGHLPKVHEWQNFTPRCQGCLAMCHREHDFNVCGFARCHQICTNGNKDETGGKPRDDIQFSRSN